MGRQNPNFSPLLQNYSTISFVKNLQEFMIMSEETTTVINHSSGFESRNAKFYLQKIFCYVYLDCDGLTVVFLNSLLLMLLFSSSFLHFTQSSLHFLVYFSSSIRIGSLGMVTYSSTRCFKVFSSASHSTQLLFSITIQYSFPSSKFPHLTLAVSLCFSLFVLSHYIRFVSRFLCSCTSFLRF